MEEGNAHVFPQAVNTVPANAFGPTADTVNRVHRVEGSRGQIWDYWVYLKELFNSIDFSPHPCRCNISNKKKEVMIVIP